MTRKNKKNIKKTARKQAVIIRGRGKYTTSAPSTARKVLRGGGALAGAAIGGYFGNPMAGAQFGYGLGDTVATIVGAGSYSVRKNSVLTNDQVPFMHRDGTSVTVAHREYLGDVISSATAGEFKASRFIINPGTARTFPWLFALSQAFEEYEFRGLVFAFKSTSANALNSVNTNLGVVSMAVAYDAMAPLPRSKIDLLNMMWAVDAKPSENCICPVECDRSQTPLNTMYIRHPGTNDMHDVRFMDLGVMDVCTSGMQGTSVNVGELWVTYDVILRKPISSAYAGGQTASAVYQANGDDVDMNDLYHTLSLEYAGCFDTIGLEMANDGGDYYCFMPHGATGFYMVTHLILGTEPAALTSPTLTLRNATYCNNTDGDGNYPWLPGTTAGLTTNLFFSQFVIEITDADKQCSFRFSGGTMPAGIVVELKVIKLNSSGYEHISVNRKKQTETVVVTDIVITAQKPEKSQNFNCAPKTIRENTVVGTGQGTIWPCRRLQSSLNK